MRHSPDRCGFSALLILLAILGNAQSSHAASASWNPLPTNNNWIAAPTTNNWSTGAGTFPGATSGTSSSDIATFNTNSSITTINNASGFVIGGIVFDTTNASAYTINTSGGTWRVVGTGIHVTGTVTNRETINGTLRMASSGTLNVISDSTIPSATLNIPNGISVNNSGNFGTLILSGTNTGPNVLGGYIEQTPASILGNLIKSNTGTWLLTAAGTYHSNTFILGGTLELVGAGTITNSTNIVVNTGTLSISNILSNPNFMWVTNAGALILTNTAPTQTPLTIGTLTSSNATFHLGVNGSSAYTDISVTTALNAGPNITLEIDRIVNLTSQGTFTLINYPGADPNPANFTVTVPSGYSASPVSVGGGAVTVTITPPTSTSLVWVGKTNSVLVSNWDINKTADWVDAATLSIPQAYVNPDSVQFDDTAANSTVTLITTNLPGSLNVNNNSLNYTFNGAGKISGFTGLTKNGSASLTLADNGDDFSGGIVLNAGTIILDNTNGNISGGLSMNGGTTAQIGNNDANGALPAGPLDDEGTLIFSRANGLTVPVTIAGGGALTQNGNGTLTLTASNDYTGVTIVSKGTLALAGAGMISNSVGLLVSNATFDVSAIAGTTLLTDFSIANASINVSATNLLTPILVNTFEVDGILAVSNIINVLTLPAIASYPATIPLIKSANAITLTGGNFNFALGSLPAASQAYAGSLSESADGTTILLTLTSGPTGQRSFVTWVGIDNTSATTNWSDGLNWQLPGAPGVLDNVFFGGGSTTVPSEATVNNFVDTSFTISSLTYDQTASGQWHVTQIPAGNTLTVSGAMTVGGLTNDSVKTEVAMVDAGTLVLNNSLTIGNNGIGGADTGTILDLSGLSNFVFNASGGSITMGTGNRSAANFNLAQISNSITAASFNANTASASSSDSGTVTLGPGTNNLNVGTFDIAAERSGCTVQFPSGATSGGLRLRGTAGTDTSRSTVVLGNRNAGGSSGTTTGTLSLNGYPVDMKMGTFTIGECSEPTPVVGSGVLNFDTGTIDATTINMAINSNTGSANGSATIGANATLIVGTGGMSLVNQTSTGTASSTLTLNGGTIICSNSIIKSTTSASTANITLTGGTVNMVSGTIGTLAAPIDNLTLNGGTVLQLSVVAGATNIVAASVSAGGTTTINIASFAGLTGTTQIPLFYYGSGDPYTSLALGTVPANYVVGNGGALIDNTANQTIDILITPPAPIVWVGAVGSVLNSTWNTSTPNWLNGVTPTTYADADYVQFDDTASNNIATLATTVSPTGLVVNNSVLNYTFNGIGSIGGLVGLVKEGSATLILDNSGANTFSGGVNLAGGTLQIGNNDTSGNLPATGGIVDDGALAFNRMDSNTVPNVISGTGTVLQTGTGTNKFTAINTYTGNTVISAGMIIVTNAVAGNSAVGPTTGAGSVIITNSGTLDIENTVAQAITFTNTTDTAGKQFLIAGAGVGGNGAIVNNNPPENQQDAVQNLALTANATVGGPGRWDLRVPDGKYQPILDLRGFTLTKTGSNQMSMVSVTVTNGGNIIINNGILSFEVASSNSTASITINAGGVMGHFRENAGFFTAPITLNGGMIRDLNGTPGSTNDSPITLTANSFLDLNVGSTDQLRLNGNITESGGSFGLTKTNIGSFSLAGVNTYSGSTLIVQGTLILANNGSISQSKLISLSTNTTFDASQRIDQTLTLNAGQTLSGFGTVTGLVSAVSGSIIAPGSVAAIGTLTFDNNVTLAGTNTMKVSHVTVATNDVLNLVSPATLALGGTLNISLLGGTYAAGDSFKLFNAPGGLSGTFSATNLPALPAGLGWVSTNLVNGILSIVATVNTNPTNITATVSGGNLNLSWPADHTGWRLIAQTNSLGSGLNPNTNAWFTVPGSASVNSESIPIDATKGTVFYRLVYP